MREGKLVLLHGFSNEEAVAMMRALKAAAADPGEIAFAVTTPTNLEWKIKDLVEQVRLEHEYLKGKPARPPKGDQRLIGSARGAAAQRKQRTGPAHMARAGRTSGSPCIVRGFLTSRGILPR